MIKLSTLIKRNKTAIRFKNDEQQLVLRLALDAQGQKWFNGDSFATHAIKDNDEHRITSDNCINPKSGRYGPYDWYIANGYKVYSLSQVILDN